MLHKEFFCRPRLIADSVYLLLLLLIFAVPVHADSPMPPDVKPNLTGLTYAELSERLNDARARIAKVKDSLTWADAAQVALIKKAEAAKSLKTASGSDMDVIKQSIAMYSAVAGNAVSQEQVQSWKTQWQIQLSDAETEATKIESEISTRAEIEVPQQKFKTAISIVFAVLIALVIAGFYGIALMDNNVRAGLLAGTAGLQFITVFTVVIAIILFGITNILDSKELSALLGGLTGYILGRSQETPGQHQRTTATEQGTGQVPPVPGPAGTQAVTHGA